MTDYTTGTSGGPHTGLRTVTAMFDDRSDAEDAVESLVSEGISRDRIRMVAGTSGETTGTTSYSDTDRGGFWDSLADFFFPDEDRSSYAEGLRRGGYLVTVTTDESRYDRVVDILDDEGTIDMDERESAWRSEGWSATAGGGMTGTQTGMTGGTSSGTAGTHMAGAGREEEVIPVVEEQLHVGKREVEAGRVRVRSYVVETPAEETVRLRREHVELQRRPVDRPVTAGDDAFRERTLEVRETSERPVVSKEAHIREEVVVSKGSETHEEKVSDTVRRTEVEVEDDRGATDDPMRRRP